MHINEFLIQFRPYPFLFGISVLSSREKVSVTPLDTFNWENRHKEINSYRRNLPNPYPATDR